MSIIKIELLLPIGFDISLVKWIMYYVSIISFVVLINGLGSPLFKSTRGLRQGCPLSPYLFLEVVDGLSWALAKAKRVNNFQGMRLRRHEHLTHFLFVDDVLIFCFCAATKGGILKDILELFCDATSMVINVNKSSIFFPHIDEDTPHLMSNLFNFPSHDLGDDV